jgi:hypothetical protein
MLAILSGSLLFNSGCANVLAQLAPLLSNIAMIMGSVGQITSSFGAITGSTLGSNPPSQSGNSSSTPLNMVANSNSAATNLAPAPSQTSAANASVLKKDGSNP